MVFEREEIRFRNGDIEIAGHLYIPSELQTGAPNRALIIATPGSSVKEQIGATYAQKMAQKGFTTLTFDPSYQGQSGGQPRDLENPSARIEDLRCALDYLTTLSVVDETNIGLLGICAGGGYAVSAAMIDHRFKAVATVVAVNVGRAFRQAQGRPDAVAQTLSAVGQQRTSEARGGEHLRINWIPDSPADAAAAGITDPDTLEVIDFYRTSRGFNQNSTNRLHFRSVAVLLGFDAFHLVGELLVQPLQVIVGGRLGTTFSYSDGRALFEKARNPKDFFVVEGAGHYEMYDKSAYVDQAVERLDGFYRQYLPS